jgi:hypothetical protein
MALSYEVRWFFDHAEPILEQWFANKGIPFHKDFPRTDFYLALEDKNDLSIKLRQGNIEVKQLVKSTNASEFNIPGDVQCWQKWSFRVEKEDDLAKQIITGKKFYWIEMPKDRLGIKYKFDDGEDGKEVSIDERIHEGCQVEYTRFQVKGKVYYTFNFEAFSESNLEKRNFQRGVELAFKELNMKTKLTAKDSMGYPEFIENNCLKK